MGRVRGDSVQGISSSIKQEVVSEISSFTLNYIKNYGGRDHPISLDELTNKMREHLSVLWDLRARTFLAFFEGIKGEIKNAIHNARKKNNEPYFFVEGVKGKIRKGYMYVDGECSKHLLAEILGGRLREWRGRDTKWDEERKLDIKIINKLLKKEEDYEKRKILVEIKQKYKETKRRESSDEEEDEE